MSKKESYEKCVECGEKAVGFFDRKPYCSRCYNYLMYKGKLERERIKNKRKYLRNKNEN